MLLKHYVFPFFKIEIVHIFLNCFLFKSIKWHKFLIFNFRPKNLELKVSDAKLL